MSDSVTPRTVHGILQARILEWVAFPFSRIFPTQGSSPGLLHCWRILYQLSHKGSPFNPMDPVYWSGVFICLSVCCSDWVIPILSVHLCVLLCHLIWDSLLLECFLISDLITYF